MRKRSGSGKSCWRASNGGSSRRRRKRDSSGQCVQTKEERTTCIRFLCNFFSFIKLGLSAKWAEGNRCTRSQKQPAVFCVAPPFTHQISSSLSFASISVCSNQFTEYARPLPSHTHHASWLANQLCCSRLSLTKTKKKGVQVGTLVSPVLLARFPCSAPCFASNAACFRVRRDGSKKG